jgi:alpha-glucosidase
MTSEPSVATLGARQPAPWWQRGVIYQVYLRSFRDANGDGIGDLAGVLSKLDYLADSLGVEAIWLSPFYPSPMADFGYDVADYTAVDPIFGDLATFDALVVAAHARGVKIIVDFVPNHSSDEHPWFRAARAARDNPYRDWYVWRDPRPDGSPPNNWVAAFGGSAWTWDAATGQYYLHSFLPEQPDLNWRNPAVRGAMYDVLRFWLDRGVDGFRMDALGRIMKDPAARDNPPNPAAGDYHKLLGEYDRQLHRNDQRHPDIHGVLRELRQVLDRHEADGQPRLAIGEIHIYDLAELGRYYGDALDELHLPFNFGLLKLPWAARAIRAHVDAYEAALPPGAWPNYVLGNHDETRIATRIGPGSARLAMLLLLTLRGTPTLYYGDELGMEDVPIPPDRVQDPWGKRVPGLGLGRDPERAPMPWDDTPNAGFCPPDVEPWLPLTPDAARINVAAQLADPVSMLSLTRRLLALRRSSPALAVGSYRPVDWPGASDACYLYLREASEERMLVALNFSDQARQIRLPDGLRATSILSTIPGPDPTESCPVLALEAGEGRVLRIGPSGSAGPVS